MTREEYQESLKKLGDQFKTSSRLLWMWNVLGAAAAGLWFVDTAWAYPFAAAGTFVTLGLLLRWAWLGVQIALTVGAGLGATKEA